MLGTAPVKLFALRSSWMSMERLSRLGGTGPRISFSLSTRIRSALSFVRSTLLSVPLKPPPPSWRPATCRFPSQLTPRHPHDVPESGPQ